MPNLPFDFQGERFQTAFVSTPGSFGYAFRDLTFEGDFGFDLTGKIRFFMLEASDRRHLRLHNAGKYSFVGFGQQGETLANVKQMTSRKSARTLTLRFTRFASSRENSRGNASQTSPPSSEALIASAINSFTGTTRMRSKPHWKAFRAQFGALPACKVFRKIRHALP